MEFPPLPWAVLQNEIWLVAVENRTARRAWGQLLFFLDKHALFWTNSATSGAAIRALMSIRPIGLVHLRQRFVRGSQWRATVLGSRTEPETFATRHVGYPTFRDVPRTK